MSLDLSHAGAGQPNLAPALPLQSQIKPPKVATTGLPEFFKTLTGKLEKEHEAFWRELYYTWELIGHFMEGRQVLRRSNRTGRWRVAGGPKSTADPVQALPVLGFYSRALLAKWVQSRVRTNVIGLSDDDQAQLTADAGNHILPYLEERIYTEEFNQKECLNAQMSGAFARYAYYDPDADGGFVERQITEPQQMTLGQSVGYCGDCNYTGQGSEFQPPVQQPDQPQPTDPNAQPVTPPPSASAPPMCPNCGSPSVDVQQASQVSIDAVTGTKTEKLGLPVGEQVPFFELRFDFAYPLEKSPFLMRSRRLRKDIVSAAFPGLKVDRGVSYDETGLESKERLATAAPLGGRGYTPDVQENELCTFKQFWLDPCLYFDYITKEDIQTVAGQSIPAGTPLIQQFPDGCYLAFVPGTFKILEMMNEHHRDHWVSSPYHLKLMSGLGYGIHEALEAQRQSNLLYNQVWTKARASATPGIVYDADVITPDVARSLGQPQKNLPAITGHLADGKTIKDSVYPLPAGSFGQELIWYSNELRTVMQLASGAIDFSAGIPGVNNNTATGAQIGASLANLQQEPVLALRAEANERFGMILLKLWQKHCHDQRYVTLKGEHGEIEGKYFSSADLSSSFIVKAEPGSWKTESDAEARDNFKQAMQLLPMFGPNPSPQALRQLGQVFNVNLGFAPYKTQARLCRFRMEQLKALTPQAQQMEQAVAVQQQQQIEQYQQAVATGQYAMPPPQMPSPADQVGQQLTGQVKPQISPFEPAHRESIEWYQDWLNTDEGIDAPDVLRSACCGMIEKHMQAQVQFTMLGQQLQAPLQVQAMQMQAAAQPQQPQQGQLSNRERTQQSAGPNMSHAAPGGANKQNGPPPQPHPQPKQVTQPGG